MNTVYREGNGSSPSTRIGWKAVKITSAPQGTEGASPEASIRAALASRSLRESCTLTLQFTGGSEGWITIKARGATWRYPGIKPILEILMDINRIS